MHRGVVEMGWTLGRMGELFSRNRWVLGELKTS